MVEIDNQTKNFSKLLWISGGVIALAIVVFLVAFFLGKTGIDESSINKDVVAFQESLKNLSWCQPASNVTKENFPKAGESLKINVVGGELVKGEILCRALVEGTKDNYYFNENLSKIYLYLAGQPRKNMTLIS